MSDVSRDHHAAIFTLLEPLTDPPTGYQLWLGSIKVPDSALTFPYLVVRRAPGIRNILNLAGNLSDLTTLTQVMAVGRDEDEVLAALDRAAGRLHGKRPVIDGRSPGLIRQVPMNPLVMPSDDVHAPEGQPTYQGVSQYELNSTAASAV